MSNEELVAAIQAGNREKLVELWAQVELFVRRMANRRPDTGAVGREDLYQSGYLALVAAVDSYNPTSGAKFTTWLYNHLLTQFNRASNYLTERERRDPLHSADRLDRPLGEDVDGDTLEDVVPDPTGEAGLDEVEERLYQEELHAALEDALATLPLDQSDLIRRRYYQGRTLREIGELRGVSGNAIAEQEKKAFRGLRKPKVSRALRAFVEERTPYYHNWSATTGERTTEMIVLTRDKLEGGRGGA